MPTARRRRLASPRLVVALIGQVQIGTGSGGPPNYGRSSTRAIPRCNVPANNSPVRPDETTKVPTFPARQRLKVDGTSFLTASGLRPWMGPIGPSCVGVSENNNNRSQYGTVLITISQLPRTKYADGT